MTRRVLEVLVFFVLATLSGEIAAEASAESDREGRGPRRPALSTLLESLQCPPPPAGGWISETDAVKRGEIRQDSPTTAAADCWYKRNDSFGTLTMVVYWWTGANPPTGPAGFCGRQETTTNTTALRQSPTKAAYIQVGDSSSNPVGPSTLVALGQPLLAQAEARAAACQAASAADPQCPPTIGRSPLSTVGTVGKVQQERAGRMHLSCTWPSGQEAIIDVIWYPSNPPPDAECRLPESVGTPATRPVGQPTQTIVRYSQTKAAYVQIFGNPAIMDQLSAAAAQLLTTAEAGAAPCPRAAASAQPTAAPTAAASAIVARSPTAVAGVVPPKSDDSQEVGPDDLYREGTVKEKGLPSTVLEPGSDLPGDNKVAIAGVVVATVATGMAAAAAASTAPAPAGGRRRRGGGGLLPRPDDLLAERLTSERNRVVIQELGRHGVSAPMVDFLGGPGEIFRKGTRFVRNPIRAAGEFFRDVGHNFRHPDELGRHFVNGIKRAVASSPPVLVVRLLSNPFRRRPRTPRGGSAPAGAVSSQRISDVVSVESAPLSDKPPEALSEEEMYGPDAGSTGSSGRGGPL